MHILITNVGNVRAQEIRSLALALNKKHRVTVACMAVESSCKGQAFSYCGTPVRANSLVYHEGKNKTERIMAHEFYGTPADAVSIMLGEIMKHDRPDIVICGINNGVHMGQDIFCSSSIGMAMEAAYFGVPAIAVAIERRVGGHDEAGLANAVKFVEKDLDKITKLDLPKYTFLNINIPTAEKYTDIKGVKVTRLGWVKVFGEFDKRVDHKGQDYYWTCNVEPVGESGEGTDIYEWNKGYVTITPIDYNATDYDELHRYKGLQPLKFIDRKGDE